MKNKKTKLLKTLVMAGAFGVVGTVPLIVSACSSSTIDSKEDSSKEDNSKEDGVITPMIKSEVSLQGKLSGIYDTSTGRDRKDTNTLIAEDIKNNLDKYFDNADQLKDVIQTSAITVDGGFSEKSTWEGEEFSNWVTTATKALYPPTAPKIDITSLNGLKDENLKDDASIQEFLKNANFPFTKNATNFRVENKPSLENGDLLHINIRASRGNTRDLELDLQIPVSSINLKINLKVFVSTINNQNGKNIKKDFNLNTNFNYSIGIDPTVNFNDTKTPPDVTEEESKDVEIALNRLGFHNFDGEFDNKVISSAVGIFNSKFEPVSIREEDRKLGKYVISLTVEPFNELYFWDDGTLGPKTIEISVKLEVSFGMPQN